MSRAKYEKKTSVLQYVYTCVFYHYCAYVCPMNMCAWGEGGVILFECKSKRSVGSNDVTKVFNTTETYSFLSMHFHSLPPNQTYNIFL